MAKDIYMAGNQVDEIYLGANDCTQVYKGSTLIWEAAQTVYPSGNVKVMNGTEGTAANQANVTGDFTLTFDMVWSENSGTGGQGIVGDDTAVGDHGVFLYDSGHGSRPDQIRVDINNGVDGFAGFLTGVSEGDKISVKVTRTGSTLETFLNNVSKGTATCNTTDFGIKMFGNANGAPGLQAGAYIQNVLLDDGTNTFYWPLDEGSGSTSSCYDGVGGSALTAYDITWVNSIWTTIA